jgi:hypothetical protein
LRIPFENLPNIRRASHPDNRIGRPNSVVNIARIGQLRASSASWRETAQTVGQWCENTAALSLGAGQNPVRFDARKCFIISGALSVPRAWQVREILPLIAQTDSRLLRIALATWPPQSIFSVSRSPSV